MKATLPEFRFRFLFGVMFYLLGFIAPWNIFLHFDSIRSWQLLASWPARNGWIGFSTATIVVLVLGILCAFAGAFLRTWASAYLDPSVVKAGSLYGDSIVASGPYRYVRNPLYFGTMIHTFALALLMPPSGALFCILAIAFFHVRLIAGEEFFLTAKLGAPYIAYCARVPRLFPSAATPRIPASSTQPAWLTAFLSEIYMWGVFVSFAALGWRYNSVLIIKGVVISLGVSLIVRAFIPKK
jgi:protein-S-isoprenylcysteine O-methyltransferase Ste14